MSREMKDSGVEWLGEIPKGWNVKKGKALYSITTGKLDANAEEPTGIYPFFTCSMFPKKINQYIMNIRVKRLKHLMYTRFFRIR